MRRTVRLFALWLALAAMLPRALIPLGWMPNPSPSDGGLVTVCTMNGPVRMRLGLDKQPMPVKHDDGRHNDICPFAASPHAATPPGLIVYEAVAIAPARAEIVARSNPIGKWQRHSPQSPRAPPQAA